MERYSDCLIYFLLSFSLFLIPSMNICYLHPTPLLSHIPFFVFAMAGTHDQIQIGLGGLWRGGV